MSDVGMSTPDPGGASRQPLVVGDDTGGSAVVKGEACLDQGIQGMQAESRVTVRGRPALSGWASTLSAEGAAPLAELDRFSSSRRWMLWLCSWARGSLVLAN